MSLQGLFIETKQEVPLNAAVDVTVYHSPNSSIRFRVNVVRCEKTGIGMKIENMDINSFAHLRDIIAMQCNDQYLIIRETYKMTSSIH